VVGPPVARWAGSLGISSLFELTAGCEIESAFGLLVLRSQTLASLTDLRTLHLGCDALSAVRRVPS
jgi:hypothetical protein